MIEESNSNLELDKMALIVEESIKRSEEKLQSVDFEKGRRFRMTGIWK